MRVDKKPILEEFRYIEETFDWNVYINFEGRLTSRDE